MYFGYPLLYPNIVNNETLNDEVVVQSKYLEINSTALIWDSNLTPNVMPDTEMNITTQGNTKLSVSFDAQLELLLVDTFESNAYYNITLQIEGVKQETVRIIEYHGEPIVGEVHRFIYLQISFETGILSAGTYDISIIWYSKADTATLSRLSVGVNLIDNLIRTLSAQEIKV